MASIITALTIIGAVALPDGADAFVPNGVGAFITLPDDGTSTVNPQKIELTVQDPGYDANGNLLLAGLGGPVRKITGRARFRKQWANQATFLDSATTGTRTTYFSLSDIVYQGSVISGATANAGYYGGAIAGSIPNVTNNSTRSYYKPLFAWLNAQHDRAPGASLYVEGYAAHRHAMNGRAVACVKYAAKDAQATPGQTAEVVSNNPILSTLCKQGNPPEVFAANIAQAGLANGDLCLANAKIYPWLGDATAVLDLSVDGVNLTGAWTTSSNPQTPLRFVCDLSGGYGGGLAYVRPTGTKLGTDTTGVFTALQSGLSNAQCYASIDTAAQALAAWSGTNKGHADTGGHTVYLTDDGAGGAVVYTTLSNSRAAGKCYLDIKKDPNATGAISGALSTQQGVSSLTRFMIPIAHTAANGFNGFNSGGKILAFEDMTLDCTGSGAAVPLHYSNPLTIYRNVTVVNPLFNQWQPFNGPDTARIPLALGVVVDTTGNSCIFSSGTTILGCRMKRTNPDQGVGQDRGVWANNKFLQILDVNARGIGGPGGIATTGFAIIQNIWEGIRASNGAALWGIGFDNSTVALDNIVMAHNSIPGSDITNRYNGGYTDDQNTGTGGTLAGVVKRIHYRNNIFGQYNAKSDTFSSTNQGGTATNTGRVGNWSIRYHVGDEGNIFVSSTQNGDLAPDLNGGSWIGEQLNPSNSAGVTAAFVDQKAGQGAAGNGDYRLSGSTNAAFDRVAGPATSGVTLNGVAVSIAPLKYDIAGRSRLMDGTGAAGAYERDLLPIGGVATITEGSDTASGVGKLAIVGGANVTEGSDTVAGAGTVLNTGRAALTEGADTVAGAAILTGPGPIVTRGAIAAGSDRIVAVSTTGSGYSWAQPFDPSDRAPYAIDWSGLLREGETIAQIDRIAMSAGGAALGVQVDTTSGRSPMISTDGLRTQIWFDVDDSFEGNAAFSGVGVRVGLSVLVRTDATPYEAFERTAVLTVRQQ